MHTVPVIGFHRKTSQNSIDFDSINLDDLL